MTVAALTYINELNEVNEQSMTNFLPRSLLGKEVVFLIIRNSISFAGYEVKRMYNVQVDAEVCDTFA